MPNVRGPRARTRRLILVAAALGKPLYGAPLWSCALDTAARRRQVERVRRALTLRITSAYRTVSTAALAVLAGVPPVHLLADERRSVHQDTVDRPHLTEADKHDVRIQTRERLLVSW